MARSTSRIGAVLDPDSSVSIARCSLVNTNAARFVFLAMITPVKSCTSIMTIIDYFVALLMERTTSQLLDRGESVSAAITALNVSANPWERIEFAVYLDQ